MKKNLMLIGVMMIVVNLMAGCSKQTNSPVNQESTQAVEQAENQTAGQAESVTTTPETTVSQPEVQPTVETNGQ